MPNPSESLKVEFHPFDSSESGKRQLEGILGLTCPPFASEARAFRQLRYVERYAADLGCQCVAVESHYIDRDYIEDHSVFYSKSLQSYANFCQRIHFFNIVPKEASSKLLKIVETGIQDGKEDYGLACRQFSEEVYLGFLVIKPLHGSPVGRTVLRCFDKDPREPGRQELFRRDFGGTFANSVHLLGSNLTVQGLAFQQQDIGVSACATTAVWSALQKVRASEEIPVATPAQITMSATKYSLIAGRPMPSEGLNLDQMCQAIQSYGVSPNLVKINDFDTARSCLYSALISGIAPILLLRDGKRRHAVVAVGSKIKKTHDPALVAKEIDDNSGDLVGLYVHDDRFGPYLRAELLGESDKAKSDEEKPSAKAQLYLVLRAEEGLKQKKECWDLTHVLLPVHNKIRLSFADLRSLAVQVVRTAHTYRDWVRSQSGAIAPGPIMFEHWLIRAHKYIEELILNLKPGSAESIHAFCQRFRLSRYLGAIRITSPFSDPIDILIDTTSTKRNVNCVGMVALANTRWHTEQLLRDLSRKYENSPTLVLK